jgi:hypothetical protein
VAELPRFIDSVLNSLLCARRLWQAPLFRLIIRVSATSDNPVDALPDLAQVHTQVFEHVRADSRTFLDNSKQNVFRADVLVSAPTRMFGRELHALPCAVSESFIHA